MPTEYDLMNLKRIGRYLAGTLNHRLIIQLRETTNNIELVTDASWARGRDRKSVSGIVMMLDGILFGAWSKTQKVLSHSSCEAEIIAAHCGLTEAKLLLHLLQERCEVVGEEAKCVINLYIDSTSTIGFSNHRGPGSMKHIDLKYLSLQDDVRNKTTVVSHVSAHELVADYLTKPSTEERLYRFLEHVNLVPSDSKMQVVSIALEPAWHEELCVVEALHEATEEAEESEWKHDFMFASVLMLAAYGLFTLLKDNWRRCARRLRRWVMPSAPATVTASSATVRYSQATPLSRGRRAMETWETWT